MNDVNAALLTLLATVSVAVIGALGNRWLKRTPEAVAPERHALDTLKELREQFKAEREARIEAEARLTQRIDTLEAELKKYVRDQVELKKHIIRLEDYLADSSVPPLPRPESVNRIFNE